jgi:hypothetical protein
MKKILIALIIIVLGCGIYYLSSRDNKQSLTIQNITELTNADKTKIASVIYKGEQILRSKNPQEIRKLFQDANPKNSMSNLPDSALISLSELVSKTIPVTETDILNSPNWTLKDNIVSVAVKKSDHAETIFRAILRDGVWYHY